MRLLEERLTFFRLHLFVIGNRSHVLFRDAQAGAQRWLRANNGHPGMSIIIL
jgi:hypothetical protein